MFKLILLAAAVAAPTALGATDGPWHWKIFHDNAVSGAHLKDPGVHFVADADTWEKCLAACQANPQCQTADFAQSWNNEPSDLYKTAWSCDVHEEHNCESQFGDYCYYEKDSSMCKPRNDMASQGKCGFINKCYIREDSIWDPVPGTGCNHTSAHKFGPPPPPPPPPPPAKPPLGYQPNIVFILTDDQDQKLGPNDYSFLGSLEAMPSVRKNLMDGGVMFKNYFVATTICCPSRTEFFTGRYYHNIGPPNKEGNCMHVDTTPVAGNTTGLFGLMGQAGYVTGVFGKVTNDQTNILKLASEQNSMQYIDSPVNYNDYNGLPYWRKFPNGTFFTENLDKDHPMYKTTYQSTQIGNRSLAWLEEVAHGPKPFFAYIGPHAPHYPAVPAPWNTDKFAKITAPMTPNYNHSSPNKTQHIRQNPALDAQAKCWEDQHMRDRWMSLISVDDIVDAWVNRLTEMKLMDKTFIFYSSDHGYKLGQWRVGTSKQHPYETDIHIPFLARGPGITAGTINFDMSGNVDLTPTLVDLAAGKDFIPTIMDGKSILPLILNSSIQLEDREARAMNWRDRWLIEYKSVGTYYNDHSGCWSPPNYDQVCGGKMPRGPGNPTKCNESMGVGDGNCYFVDSTHSNSWRALRIENSTTNITYIEYDPMFLFNESMIVSRELYDLNHDEYQMHNLVGSTSDAKLAVLHSEIQNYWICKMAECP